MAVKKVRPMTNGQRGLVKIVSPHLFKGEPYKALTEKKSSNAGRNNYGRITIRHRGGGHKEKYRVIDFKRYKDEVSAKVERIEYDPNRTSHIALLLYQDGQRRYIVSTRGLAVGDVLQSGSSAAIKNGNCLPIRDIPVGTTICLIEMRPGKGAQLSRAAGTSAQLLARDADYAQIRLKSGEVRRINVNCRAVIGSVSNEENSLRKLGKAGAQRWRGVRPTVRGVAMNPIDHPHGGGSGKTGEGRHPVSPWGQHTKGYKTRRNKRTSSMILQRRRKGRK